MINLYLISEDGKTHKQLDDPSKTLDNCGIKDGSKLVYVVNFIEEYMDTH